MGRLFIIKKVNEDNHIYYYAVYKENSLNEVSHYMGLDVLNKKILFFEKEIMKNAFSIYDISKDKFEKQHIKLNLLIGSSAVI